VCAAHTAVRGESCERANLKEEEGERL